jgi:hypothetical protein
MFPWGWLGAKSKLGRAPARVGVLMSGCLRDRPGHDILFTPPSRFSPDFPACPRRRDRSARAVSSCTTSVIQPDLHQPQFRPQTPAGVRPELHALRVAGEDEDVAFLDAGLAEFRLTGIHEPPADATTPVAF